MKNAKNSFLTLLAILFFSWGFVNAEETDNNSTTEADNNEEKIIDVNFSVEPQNNGSEIKMSWGDFDVGKDVKWYKIMASKTNDDPKYPDEPAIKVLEATEDNNYTLIGPPVGEYYYRICMVAVDESVYCSENVEKISIENGTTPTTETQFIDVNFEAKKDDSSPKIVMNWESFNVGKDVKWYKIVGSKVNDNPTYPNDTTFKVLDSDANNTYTLNWPPKGEYYYRICMVAVDESIYCSENVEKINNNYYEDEKKSDWKKSRDEGRKNWLEYKKDKKNDWKEKRNEYIEKWKKKKAEYKTKTEKNYYGNVDKKLEIFFEKVDEKFDTNEAKKDYLEEKVVALNNLVNAKPKYKDLVDFIIEAFELKIQEYTNPSEIDEIDDILGI